MYESGINCPSEMEPRFLGHPTCSLATTLTELSRPKNFAKINNKKFWEELTAYFPWYDTGHIENDASKYSCIVACVFVTAVTFQPSPCLATIVGFLSNLCLATIRELLPNRCRTTIGEGIHRHTRTATWSHKPTLFFQNRKVGEKTENVSTDNTGLFTAGFEQWDVRLYEGKVKVKLHLCLIYRCPTRR
jgi:hypothetical protein